MLKCPSNAQGDNPRVDPPLVITELTRVPGPPCRDSRKYRSRTRRRAQREAAPRPHHVTREHDAAMEHMEEGPAEPPWDGDELAPDASYDVGNVAAEPPHVTQRARLLQIAEAVLCPVGLQEDAPRTDFDRSVLDGRQHWDCFPVDRLPA